MRFSDENKHDPPLPSSYSIYLRDGAKIRAPLFYLVKFKGYWNDCWECKEKIKDAEAMEPSRGTHDEPTLNIFKA